MSVEGEDMSVFWVEACERNRQGEAGSDALLGAREGAEQPAGWRGGGKVKLGMSGGPGTTVMSEGRMGLNHVYLDSLNEDLLC